MLASLHKFKIKGTQKTRAAKIKGTS